LEKDTTSGILPLDLSAHGRVLAIVARLATGLEEAPPYQHEEMEVYDEYIVNV